MGRGRLAKPIYESLPALYVAGGTLMMALSYHNRDTDWSGPCGVLGVVGWVAGLAIWMHRRDYRATSADYLRRGKPVSGVEEPRG